MEFDEPDYGVDRDSEEELTQGEIWKIVSLFFSKKGLVKQQLRSYEMFIETQIDSIVKDKGFIELQSNQLRNSGEGEQPSRIFVTFDEVKVRRPTCEDGKTPMYPQTARIRQLSYSLDVLPQVECRVVRFDNGRVEDNVCFSDRRPIAKIPVMVRSRYCQLRDTDAKMNECEFDPGGYFIVNGSEKVIIGQEHMVINKPIVFARKSEIKYDLTAQIRSQPLTWGRLSQPFDIHLLAPSKAHPQRVIHAKLAKMEKTVPLMILFRAMNVLSDKEILMHICYDPEDNEFLDVLRPSIEESSTVSDYLTASDFIARRATVAGADPEVRMRKVKELLGQILLPHLGESPTDITRKTFFVGYMAHLLVETSLKRREEDDRDHYCNKRLDLAGPLISSLFASLFEKMRNELTSELTRNVKANFDESDLKALLTRWRPTSITKGLEYSIATGNWNANRQAVGSKVGVSQALNRLTYISTLSNLRRTNTPIGRDAKLTKPRHLHNTHWGYICPVETPEGHACGLIKNLALMTLITTDRGSDQICEINNLLDESSVTRIEEVAPEDIANGTKIFVNGAWYGIHHNGHDVVQRLLMSRRQHQAIRSDVSIVHNIADKEVFVWCDGGRVTRPLLIVENKRLTLRRSWFRQDEDRLSWKELLRQGHIEYLDVDEEENMMIAMYQKDLYNDDQVDTYTHCEIHPSLVLGVCGSIIPFPDHNQSPRNTYQCAMGKQAIGLYATNFQVRMDSSAHVLWYPQKPLVTTHSMQHLHFKELPAGINCCVAIACYTGYNQEDSLMLNQSAIDRGLFRSFFFRTYSSKAKSDSESFEIPTDDKCKMMKHGDHTKLGEDGIANIGKRVTGGDIVIGKVIRDAETSTDRRQYKDGSTEVRPRESGIVDMVVRTVTGNGDQLVKVRTRAMRTPQIGDKFSSRHGQKGVCGMTYRQEDMPFTREGIVPDIIMNPHALPSRMTIGQLIECLLGKVSAIKGIEGNATPFCDVSVDRIANELHELGYERTGNEIFTNGRTGKRLRAKLFFGPTYYQRLKHMVADKVHGRACGPVTLLLRQPVEGRSRNGGLRFGEMERDCLVAHGVSAMLRDRLLENSDRLVVCVCRNCGMIAVETPAHEQKCLSCKAKGKFAELEIPYAFKLVLQELISMCIAPRLTLSD